MADHDRTRANVRRPAWPTRIFAIVIETQTLLVLGAGASNPYGLPLGYELTRAIISAWGGGTDLEIIADAARVQPGRARQVIGWFRDSGFVSIDKFLTLKRLDDNGIKVGKACIAYFLSNVERPEYLKVGAAIADDWYAAVWKALSDSATSPEDISRNKLRIATFNYDRSLESYLAQRVVGAYGVSEREAWGHLQRIEIEHLYGSLGTFNPNATEHRPYAVSTDPQLIRQSMDGIKVMHEHREESGSFARVREWLEESRRVCFLGFGFDTLNVERLGFGDVFSELVQRNVGYPILFASALGATSASTFSQRALVLGPNRPKRAIARWFDANCTGTILRSGIFEPHIDEIQRMGDFPWAPA